MGARYYDGQVGRFASRDSRLDELPYTYCVASPTCWADPSGHSLSDPYWEWWDILLQPPPDLSDKATLLRPWPNPWTGDGGIGDLIQPSGPPAPGETPPTGGPPSLIVPEPGAGEGGVIGEGFPLELKLDFDIF